MNRIVIAENKSKIFADTVYKILKDNGFANAVETSCDDLYTVSLEKGTRNTLEEDYKDLHDCGITIERVE